ncbi:RNA polymerase sigma factor [Algoriphagus confluentis]
MNSFFETHIWPLKGRLYRMVYLWTKDRDLAEDVLQNVFEKSVIRQHELRSHPNLGGWLVKSLKNEMLMHYRKIKPLDSLEKAGEISQPESNKLETEQEHQLVLGLVEELSPKQRDVFLLREVEEMSYEEISTHLEIPLEQVKVNLHRARTKIREKLINQGITP